MLNCAQAVLYAYQQVRGETVLSIAELKPCGGGRAPGGLCGAIHGACLLAPQNAEQLRHQFAERLGSVLCQELKRVHRQPCEVCVAEAAGLLEELG